MAATPDTTTPRYAVSVRWHQPSGYSEGWWHGVTTRTGATRATDICRHRHQRPSEARDCADRLALARDPNHQRVHEPCDAAGIACTVATHDHTTPVDRDGRDVDPPIPMLCNDCAQPTHYSEALEWYVHDSAPECFLAFDPNHCPTYPVREMGVTA